MRSRIAACLGVALATLSCAALVPALVRAEPPAAAPASELDRHVYAGWQAFAARRFAEAREHFARARKLAPERADVHLGLGEALFWLGDHRGALARFERAVRLAPELAAAHSGMGHAYLNLSLAAWQQPRTSLVLLERAEQAFSRALQLDPGLQAARDGRRYLAEHRKQKGSSLAPLEAVIAALLLALALDALLRLRARRLPPWRAYLWPLGLFAATRAFVFAAFAAAPTLVPEAPSHPHAVLRDPGRFVLDSIAGRWDANLYAATAIEGYSIPPLGEPGVWGTVGQFPLLPVLLRWSALALDDALLAAAIVPNAALLLACLLLFSWFREQHGERLAAGAVCVLLVHPASLHGSVLYAESLALLGMAGLALQLQRGAPVRAAPWGVLAGLARINTLAIVPWLLLDAWRGDARARPRAIAALAAALTPALGLGVYMLYTQHAFGNAFAYFEEMRIRRLGGGPLLTTFWETIDLVRHVAAGAGEPLHGGPLPLLLLGLACLVIYVAAAIALVRERRLGPALFVASGILLAMTSTLAAQPRYLWLLFPAAPVVARACDRPVLRWAAPAASLCALGAASVAYARWYFVP